MSINAHVHPRRVSDYDSRMTYQRISRRQALAIGGAAVAASATRPLLAATSTSSSSMVQSSTATSRLYKSDEPLQLRFAVKWGMINIDAPIIEKFRILQSIGFDGVELDSPGGPDVKEVRAASETTGLPVHGLVDSIHWNVRLSDPDPAVREKGRIALENAIRDSKAYGGSSVLLVPGVAGNKENENQQQCWDRSIEQIHKALPVAAELGIHILIENVWNRFCYDHDGGTDQSADQLAAYIDAINSPWVGSYFDIGNHRKYARPEQWIRTLGKRITKCDVKDWGVKGGWAEIGEGDIDWAAVRSALRDIGYTGWCTAEVGGGDEQRLATIKAQMDKVLRS